MLLGLFDLVSNMPQIVAVQAKTSIQRTPISSSLTYLSTDVWRHKILNSREALYMINDVPLIYSIDTKLGDFEHGSSLNKRV